MANISLLSRLVNGVQRQVDLSANTLVLGGMQLKGATSGTFTQSANGTTTTYAVIWPAAQGGANTFLKNDGAGNLTWAAITSGTVTSVNVVDGSTTPIFGSTGGPVTTSGTITLALATQAANSVFAGPTTGAAAQPTFRALVVNDIPSLSSLYLPLSGGTMTGAINLGGFAPTNSTTPVNPNDLVNKSYVDNFINATSWKTAVLVATTANITLSGEQTIDGFLTSGSLVLVKNQTAPAQNGIYVSAAGAWSRAADMATWAQVPAAAVFVQEGTVNADLGFVCTSQPGGTIGTTAINWVQFSSAGAYSADGVTLQLVSGVFSIKNGGVTETQINSSALSTTGALTGGSGTKLAVQVDASTITINGSNQLNVPAAGITKTQANTNLFDQTTIVGGAGTSASVAQAPKVAFAGVAGQAFSANTTYAVRFGLPANSETAGRLYMADITTTSFDLFWVVGFIQPTSAVSIGGAVNVIAQGQLTLLSGDTVFGANDPGKPIFLQAGGTNASTTPPSTAGQAVAKLGIVTSTSTFLAQIGSPNVA